MFLIFPILRRAPSINAGKSYVINGHFLSTTKIYQISINCKYLAWLSVTLTKFFYY